jgi:DNA polymerase-3 subunit alpha
LEKAVRYGSKFQENENSSQVSLFGESSDVQIAEPIVPPCEEWSTIEKLAKEKEVVGIYISGHPLDDYRFEMKYFCNSKLENLKNLLNYIGKTLTFAGIVTNVQYRTAKNGKDWALFTVEGYDESHEFRIFDEEYLKLKHYLVNNQFIYFKIGVKDGWVNRETGKKSEPRIMFQDAKLLANVLTIFAKKLIIQTNIADIQPDYVHQLSALFQANKGDHSVLFEVMEFEKVKRLIETPLPEVSEMETVSFDGDEDTIEATEPEISIPTEIEEMRIITKLEMPSRKLKIKISNELLFELEKMQVNFKLN